MKIAELMESEVAMVRCANREGFSEWANAIPIMVDLMSRAIVWRYRGCPDSDGKALLTILDRFDECSDSAG